MPVNGQAKSKSHNLRKQKLRMLLTSRESRAHRVGSARDPCSDVHNVSTLS